MVSVSRGTEKHPFLPRERFYKIKNLQGVISSLNKGFEVISSLVIIDVNLQSIFLYVYR